MDIQKSSESLSVATSGGNKWLCARRSLEKPGFMGIRNWHAHLLPHLSLSVHVPTWLCTHMHMWALTRARPKHTSVGCWRRNYSLFCYESGEVFLTVSGVCSFLNLLVLSMCLLDHPRPLGAGTKQHLPLDQRALLGSCPQPLNSPYICLLSFVFPEPGVQKLLSRSSIDILC